MNRRHGALLVALALVPATAHARPPPPKVEELPPPTYRLNFQAGEVELDDELKELVLSHNVVVQVDRYRLKSDRLHLRRTPRGIVVEGSGEVAFCPCPEPPVTLGFRSALVAPPTDLLIEQPTFRVEGVPVFWLPYIWLRAPNRTGLLPPRFEWRKTEGFVAGSGVHVPIDATAVDVFGSGYFNGGARVAAAATGSDAALRVVWDHYRQTALVLDGRGSTTGTAGVIYAFDVDALRGARGRTAALSLEEAALRADRAAAGVSTASRGAVFGASVVAEDWRGEAMDEVGFAGPRAVAAFSTGLGRSATFESALGLETLSVPTRGVLSVVAPRTALTATARPSVFAVHTALGAGGDLAVADNLAGTALRANGSLDVSVPLVRRWASGAWAHTLEPFVSGRAIAARSHDDFLDLSDGGDGEAGIAALGIRSALGKPVTRRAAEIDIRGGWIATGADVRPAVVGRMIADTPWLGTAATAVGQPGRIATLSELRVGDAAALHATGFVQGRFGLDPLVGRWLASPNWDGGLGGFFDRPGWTTGGELVIPWARWLATQAEVSVDASTRRILAYAGSLAYRHRCGCLALQTWVGHRLGREGQDGWVTVDLMP